MYVLLYIHKSIIWSQFLIPTFGKKNAQTTFLESFLFNHTFHKTIQNKIKFNSKIKLVQFILDHIDLGTKNSIAGC